MKHKSVDEVFHTEITVKYVCKFCYSSFKMRNSTCGMQKVTYLEYFCTLHTHAARINRSAYGSKMTTMTTMPSSLLFVVNNNWGMLGSGVTVLRYRLMQTHIFFFTFSSFRYICIYKHIPKQKIFGTFTKFGTYSHSHRK